MMKKTIFFSWQTDRPGKVCRNFIDEALHRALVILQQEEDVPIEEADRHELEVDRDTKGVPGMPPIVETIFKKIDAASVFVADMTFIGTRAGGRPTPNPNVLIEYGWAFKSLSYTPLIAVMNTAYGEPTADSMPFDMRHLRWPITYNCPEDASPDVRRREKESLAKTLAAAIKGILGASPAAAPVAEYTPIEPKQGSARFRAEGEALGIVASGFLRTAAKEIKLRPGPSFWLRLMPANAQQGVWAIPDVEAAARPNGNLLLPMGEGYREFGTLRAGDGWGTYATPFHGEEETRAVVLFFKTGEIWSVDTYPAQAIADTKGAVLFRESDFLLTFDQAVQCLRKLGVTGQLRWEAGLEGVRNKVFHLPTGRSIGPFLNDVVRKSGLALEKQSAVASLEQFFKEVYGECGVRWDPPGS